MSRGVNKVILIGHLGNDPDVRYTAAGAAVANIRLATNHAVKNKDTGEWQEVAEWHSVVFFDRIAEVVKQYLRKGSQIYVEGSLRTEKWQDQSGQDRYTTKIHAYEMQMLGGRSDSAGYRGETPTSYAAPMAGRPASYPVAEEPNLPPLPGESAAPSQQRWSGNSPSSSPAKNFDDDVPF